MADNVTFQPVTATPIDGTVVATDDCGGAHVQLFKQAISTNGIATLIPADASDGLLVNLGANNDVTVSGTVSATVTGVVDVGEVTGPVALPTGAATSAKQDTQTTALGTLLTDTQLRATPVPVSGTVAVTAAALPLPSGAATLAEQQTQTASLSVMDDWDETDRAKVNLVVGQAGITAGAGSVAANTPRVTHASDDPVAVSLQLIDNAIMTFGTSTYTEGVSQGQTVGVVRRDADTTLANTTNEWTALQVDANGRLKVETFVGGNPTGTLANVASSATSVTLLASNTSRLGATIYNDSTQVLYVKFGATASSSSFTLAMVAASYYEIPFGYTGIIDGIWASANGNARVTEIT